MDKKHALDVPSDDRSISVEKDGESRVANAFEAMAVTILAQDIEPELAMARLWRMPPRAVTYAYDAVVREDHEALERLERALRGQVAEIVADNLDRSEWLDRVGGYIERANRLTFRPWRDSDVAEYHALLDDPVMWEFLPETYPAPLTLDTAAELIEVSNAFPERHTVRAVASSSGLIGQVRLQFDSSVDPADAEISYWVGKANWNRGYASEIVAAFTHATFETQAAIDRVFARVIQGNDASVRVLLKAGYHMERRFQDAEGRTVDELAVYRVEYAGLRPS